MEASTVVKYFSAEQVVDHYTRATLQVGLWESERKLFTHLFKKDDRLLELGCGTGRISLALWALGYRHLLGVDLARAMVQQARLLNQKRDAGVAFLTGDATNLKASDLGDALFDGVIFGFNGLMQIPRRQNRRKAMAEVWRVLQPGGIFVFTTHDRNAVFFRNFWQKEYQRWQSGEQKSELDEFGDRYEPTELGELFIHVPTAGEVREDLLASGFTVDSCVPRSEIANETRQVRDFSDECLFWVATRPQGSAVTEDETHHG